MKNITGSTEEPENGMTGLPRAGRQEEQDGGSDEADDDRDASVSEKEGPGRGEVVSAEQPQSDSGKDELAASHAAIQDESQIGQPAKKSPQKAFNELRDEVRFLRAGMGEVSEYMRNLKEYVDETRVEVQKPLLDSLFQIFHTLFTHVVAMEGGQEPPDAFTVQLLNQLEGELARHNITVIRPRPGDPVDLRIMSTTGREKRPFWRKPNTVARTRECGFLLNDEIVLREARVDVYPPK